MSRFEGISLSEAVTSFNTARYTERIMSELKSTGMTVVNIAPDWGVDCNVARSRIHNAARRLRVKVTTTRQGNTIVGRVINEKSQMSSL